MSIIAVRSVQLSERSTNSWKSAGVAFARRGRSVEEVMGLGYSMVLNLGKSAFNAGDDHRIWNNGPDIVDLIWPGSARTVWGDLMPPRPVEFPADVWLKAPGAGGRGKYKKAIDHPLVLPREWDWQLHIDGDEWRLITVGRRIVQDLRRHGENGDREYEWIRMRHVPSRVKDIAREAASRLDGYNVIAWDIIDDGEQAYILEGNTSPGMSSETAGRIVAEMTRQQDERI